MKLLQVGIMVNMLAAILNILSGSIAWLLHTNFESMMYNLLLAIINMLFATVLAVLELRYISK